MNRREFVTLVAGAGAGFCAGCQSFVSPGAPGSRGSQLVDAGPIGSYAAPGVYGRFRDEGFFVVSKDGKPFALSSVCPHRQCTVDAEADHSFYCPCHGSTFTPDGQVTRGPAVSNLPVLEAVTNSQGNLVVKVPD